MQYKDKGTGNTRGTQLRQIRHSETEEAELNTPNMEFKTVTIKQKTMEHKTDTSLTQEWRKGRQERERVNMTTRET